MKISSEQAQAVIAGEEGSALAHNILELLREQPSEALDRRTDEELLARIEIGIARARRRRLTSPGDIGAFVGWMFAFAPNFDEHPAVQALLADPSLSPGERIDHIAELIPFTVWDEIEQRYDASVWYPELEAGDEEEGGDGG